MCILWLVVPSPRVVTRPSQQPRLSSCRYCACASPFASDVLEARRFFLCTRAAVPPCGAHGVAPAFAPVWLSDVAVRDAAHKTFFVFLCVPMDRR